MSGTFRGSPHYRGAAASSPREGCASLRRGRDHVDSKGLGGVANLRATYTNRPPQENRDVTSPWRAQKQGSRHRSQVCGPHLDREDSLQKTGPSKGCPSQPHQGSWKEKEASSLCGGSGANPVPLEHVGCGRPSPSVPTCRLTYEIWFSGMCNPMAEREPGLWFPLPRAHVFLHCSAPGFPCFCHPPGMPTALTTMAHFCFAHHVQEARE